jgi:hypothetical protein
MFASLLQFSNNPSGKPACLFFILQDSAFRIAILSNSILPCDYKMVSRQLYLLGRQRKYRIVYLSVRDWLRNIGKHIPRRLA